MDMKDWVSTDQVAARLGIQRHQLQWLLKIIGWRPKQAMLHGRRTNLYTKEQAAALSIGMRAIRGSLERST
jgi:hypothetical protein